jgi:formylglycine-generating enzyme required for sulfatase activity
MKIANRSRTLSVIAVLCIVVTGNVRAADKMAWHFRQGEQFYAEWSFLTIEQMRVGLQIQQRMQELNLVGRFHVEKVSPEGCVVELTLERVKTRALGQTAESGQDRLQGVTLHLELSDQFKIAKITGLDSLNESADALELRPMPVLTTEGYRHLVANWINHLFFTLPSRPAGDSGSWTQRVDPSPSPAFQHDWTFTPHGGATVNGHGITEYAITGKRTTTPGATHGPVDAVELTRDEYSGKLMFDATAGRLERYEFLDQMEMKGVPRLATPGPRSIWSSMKTAGTVRITSNNPITSGESSTATASYHTRESATTAKEWTNTIGVKLINIPAGKFAMAAPGDGPHEIEITRPFAIGAYEITIGQYRAFVQATGYKTQAERSGLGCFGWNKAVGKLEMNPRFTWENPGWEHDYRHPVVNVSWEDARAFCDWLSRKEKRNYRLPTEAEWEYAARAGCKSSWYWGDEQNALATNANVADAAAKKLFPKWATHDGNDGFAFTSPVGSFKPNAFGLYDMLGNAREWCEDWIWAYPSQSQRDPQGPAIGLEKVQRGGSFADTAENSTVAARIGFPPDTYFAGSGFRIVLTESPVVPYAPPTTMVGQRVLPRDAERLESLGIYRQFKRPFISPVFDVREDRLDVIRVQVGVNQALGVRGDFVRLEESEALFSKAISDKTNPESLYLRSISRFARQDFDGALKDIDQAISLDKNNATLVIERARVHEARKEYQEAAKDFASVVGRQPDNPYAHAELAHFLATCPDASVRNGEKALEHAKKAEELIPRRDGTILDSLAEAYAAIGKFGDAIRWEEQALKDSSFRIANEESARSRLAELRQKAASTGQK